mgnify:CR=1 FL=1
MFAIALQPDGKIVVGGAFCSANSIRGQTAQPHRAPGNQTAGSISRSTSTRYGDLCGQPPQCSPTARFSLAAICQHRSWRSARNNIARLNTDGTLDTTFDTGTNGYVGAIAVQPDGKILVGGDFTTLTLNGTSLVPNASIGGKRHAQPHRTPETRRHTRLRRSIPTRTMSSTRSPCSLTERS